MNKYYLYKVSAVDNILYEYKCPKLSDKVYIHEDSLELLSKKELDDECMKGLRNSGLINEWYYNTTMLNYEQYFIAVETKSGRYYSSQLKIEDGIISGKLPSFWTLYKYSLYLTVYLIIYLYLSFKLVNWIINDLLGLKPY